jgi:hypothetical protein
LERKNEFMVLVKLLNNTDELVSQEIDNALTHDKRQEPSGNA